MVMTIYSTDKLYNTLSARFCHKYCRRPDLRARRLAGIAQSFMVQAERVGIIIDVCSFEVMKSVYGRVLVHHSLYQSLC